MNQRKKALIRKIDAYAKGKLSEEEVVRLWAELVEHPEYIEYLETEMAVSEMVRKESGRPRRQQEGPKQQERRQERARSRLVWYGAAAALAILVIAYTIWGGGISGPEMPRAIASIHTEAEMYVPEVRRAGEEALDRPDSLMNAGYHAVVTGQRDEALRLYLELATAYEGENHASKARVNLGILAYNAGRFGEARTEFRRAAADSAAPDMVREKALWFLGNTLIQMEEYSSARETLERAAAMDGPHRTEAEQLLEELPDEADVEVDRARNG